MGYVENHHILPRCMGGSNERDNLVSLTGREHYIAHLLLYKIYKTQETIYACHMMAMRCEERGISYIKNSRMYETIRLEHAKRIEKLNKVSHIGKNNSQFGKMWICNLETQQNDKILRNLHIPDGWCRGRNKWKIQTRNIYKYRYKSKKVSLYDNHIQLFNAHISKIEKLNEPKLFYTNLYTQFKSKKYRSVREFVRETNQKLSQASISRGFKKYIDEYRNGVSFTTPYKSTEK